jgi:hypothetical protein
LEKNHERNKENPGKSMDNTTGKWKNTWKNEGEKLSMVT